MSSEFETEFTYILKRPIQYDFDGSSENLGQKLTVQAPTAKLLTNTCVIENLYNSAIQNYQKEAAANSNADEIKQKAEEATQDISQEELAKVILFSVTSSPDLNKAFVALKLILTSSLGSKPVCMLEDTVPFTQPLWDKLDHYDMKQLLAYYIVNFIDTFHQIGPTSSRKATKDLSQDS